METIQSNENEQYNYEDENIDELPPVKEVKVEETNANEVKEAEYIETQKETTKNDIEVDKFE